MVKLTVGMNDILSTNPEIIEEWNYSKNDILPTSISKGSNKKVWWVCKYGHEWQDSPNNRANGRGCPICSNHRVLKGYNDLATTAPALLSEWDYDKNTIKPTDITKGSGVKVWWKCERGHEWEAVVNLRNRGEGCPVCMGKKLLKGFNDLETVWPESLKEWDKEKNSCEPTDILATSKNIVWWKCEKGHSWECSISQRMKGKKCPFCSRKQRNADKVRLCGKSLMDTNTELIKEWDYEKNQIQPTEISKGSNKKVWWKCIEGHEWQDSPNNRINGRGCPFCSNHQVKAGYNDLATTASELLGEWNYERNTILPTEIARGSNKTIWWKCKLGHEWKAQVNSRKAGNGCPICSGKKVLVGFNDLATVRPDFLKEWDYEKNRISPTEITAGSNKKVWWKCKHGHEWIATPGGRKGCPYCSNQMLLEGDNDLATTNPEVLNEWDYEKNSLMGIFPNKIIAGSNKAVWWKCRKGHEWKVAVNGRTGKYRTGCPVCAKELKTSFPEQAVYYYIKRIFSDAVSGEKKLIEPYELDIYIPSLKAAIEYDGQNWHKSAQKDDLKTQKCFEKRIRLYRIREDDCPEVDDTNCKVLYYKHNDYAALNVVIREVIRDLGVEYIDIDIDIEKDTSEILKQYVVREKERSIARLYPDILEEWSYKKNTIDPDQVSLGSNKKIWWVCKKGHEWQASPNTRFNHGRKNGCPYCANQKLLVGYNDLATRFPDLIDEWNYDKNEMKPCDVTSGSAKKVWWKCENGHEWEASIVNRTRNKSGCPFCYKKMRVKKY